MTKIKEIWKPIFGYEGYYEVSSGGSIRSVNRIVKTSSKRAPFYKRKGKLLKSLKDKNGYLTVQLAMNGKNKRFRVHRLVANAFIENTENKPMVHHKDFVTCNNNTNNLEWVTHEENMFYKKQSMRFLNSGPKVKRIIQKYPNGNFVAIYASSAEAERQTGIDRKSISNCARKAYGAMTAGGYLWDYFNIHQHPDLIK